MRLYSKYLRATMIAGGLLLTMAACRQETQAPPATSAPAPAAEAVAAGLNLMSGLGDHHHPIRTTVPNAQKFFDQGFSLVFGFNHEEALRAIAEIEGRGGGGHG